MVRLYRSEEMVLRDYSSIHDSAGQRRVISSPVLMGILDSFLGLRSVREISFDAAEAESSLAIAWLRDIKRTVSYSLWGIGQRRSSACGKKWSGPG